MNYNNDCNNIIAKHALLMTIQHTGPLRYNITPATFGHARIL